MESKVAQTFEGALKSLESIVEKLEKPDLPLEESIELFEQGTKLSEVCYERLKEAEKKVELLIKKVPNPLAKEDFELKDFNTHDAS